MFAFTRIIQALVYAAYCLTLGGASASYAAVERVEVQSRVSVLGGHAFAASGAYEKLSGQIVFAFDPVNEHNQRITDLSLASRFPGAAVYARADFMVLRPVDAARGNGVALVEVSNRGGKALLAYLNAARFGTDPVTEADFGDGLLLRQGYTLIWVGWQADVPDQPQLLRLQAPIARDGTKSVTGLVRSDWVVDQATGELPLAHRNHRPYAVADVDDAANTLTERDAREAPRRVVPRTRWQFVTDGDSDAFTHIRLAGGFQPGKIYELVYRARDPYVVGLGLGVIRDIASYAKYHKEALFPARHAIAFGVSQSGRFLRHFLYQNFNTDERGRQAYDGMFIHAAGAGRGSFNHRFAQPSRDAHRYSTFFFPTDLFPFSGVTQRDAQTDVSDGLLAQTTHVPKIFYTNTGYEYWGRAASLIHTTPDGAKDIAPLANERIYHLASAQHFVLNPPLQPQAQAEGSVVYRGNPLDFWVNLRALLARLTAWVTQDAAPPPSRYPRIGEATLVSPAQVKFPAIAGMAAARLIHTAHRVDYGARWRDGIIDTEPPSVGKAFVTLAPQVDEFGNELGGVRNVELRVPLGSYAPWNLRAALPNPAELTDFLGTFAPLPLAESQRARGGDSRSSLASLYADRGEFERKLREQARQLTQEGFLLEEDVPRVVRNNLRLWDWLF